MIEKVAECNKKFFYYNLFLKLGKNYNSVLSVNMDKSDLNRALEIAVDDTNRAIIRGEFDKVYKELLSTHGEKKIKPLIKEVLQEKDYTFIPVLKVKGSETVCSFCRYLVKYNYTNPPSGLRCNAIGCQTEMIEGDEISECNKYKIGSGR